MCIQEGWVDTAEWVQEFLSQQPSRAREFRIVEEDQPFMLMIPIDTALMDVDIALLTDGPMDAMVEGLTIQLTVPITRWSVLYPSVRRTVVYTRTGE